MTFTVLMYVARRPDLTPAQFRMHYETHHVPLIVGIFGDLMPLLYKRRYVERAADAPHAATLLMGPADHAWYDCVTELEFAGRAHIDAFNERFYAADTQRVIRADEERFLDWEKTVAVVVDPIEETRGSGKWQQG